jgi:hypothetical protein
VSRGSQWTDRLCRHLKRTTADGTAIPGGSALTGINPRGLHVDGPNAVAQTLRWNGQRFLTVQDPRSVKLDRASPDDVGDL